MSKRNSNAAARRNNTDLQRENVQLAAANAGEQLGSNHPRQPSKLDLIRSLLERPGGAALDELMAATGWQPHSVRAGMSGLRKQGLTITRSKADGATRFAIGSQPVEVAA